ncbi:hypothetical protein CHCC20375_2145 [Bacillus licheniformis]|nr:hypothetical protein CHCC20375_2145 [Bacillus licheniformis]
MFSYQPIFFAACTSSKHLLRLSIEPRKKFPKKIKIYGYKRYNFFMMMK